MTRRPIGIVSPLLTPYENDLSIAESLYTNRPVLSRVERITSHLLEQLAKQPQTQ